MGQPRASSPSYQDPPLPALGRPQRRPPRRSRRHVLVPNHLSALLKVSWSYWRTMLRETIASGGAHRSSERLLWLAFPRLANRQQEYGTLIFRVRREELNHLVVEKGQPGGTQVLGIRSQVHLAADRARLQLDGAVAAVSVSLQDGIQIGQKEDIHAGVCRQLLLESEAVGLGAELSGLQKLQTVPFAV